MRELIPSWNKSLRITGQCFRRVVWADVWVFLIRA